MDSFCIIMFQKCQAFPDVLYLRIHFKMLLQVLTKFRNLEAPYCPCKLLSFSKRLIDLSTSYLIPCNNTFSSGPYYILRISFQCLMGTSDANSFTFNLCLPSVHWSNSSLNRIHAPIDGSQKRASSTTHIIIQNFTLMRKLFSDSDIYHHNLRQ